MFLSQPAARRFERKRRRGESTSREKLIRGTGQNDKREEQTRGAPRSIAPRKKLNRIEWTGERVVVGMEQPWRRKSESQGGGWLTSGRERGV